MWKYFRKNKLGLLGLSILLGVLFVAAFADLVAPYPNDAK